MADITDKKQVISKLEAMGFVWEVLAAVAIPTICFALIGRALDARWHSSPYMTIVGFIFAIALSYILIIRKARAMAERMKSPPKA